MLTFEQAVQAAREKEPPQEPVDTSTLQDGPEVQLSVRVPEGLRAAVATTASSQKTTVTAFVAGALRRAVVEANDTVAGLAADLLAALRDQLRAAIDAGEYREAAAEVDQEEGWS